MGNFNRQCLSCDLVGNCTYFSASFSHNADFFLLECKGGCPLQTASRCVRAPRAGAPQEGVAAGALIPEQLGSRPTRGAAAGAGSLGHPRLAHTVFFTSHTVDR